MAKRTEQLEEKLRKAVEPEICNGNWLYFGKGDPVEGLRAMFAELGEYHLYQTIKEPEQRAILEAAVAEITRLRLAAPVWRDIETAPKDGTRILLGWARQDAVMIAKWSEPDERGHLTWELDDDGCYVKDPTCWMPLPSPPSDQAAAVAGEERE